MSVDDAWGAAQNVIMWLTTAAQSLDGASNRSIGGFFANLLSRGHAGRSGLHEAADAIGKAKVAFVDLAFALQRAQMSPVRLTTLETPQIEYIKASTVSDMVTRDLATLEKLVADVEARQRATR
jgi:hypothetical protein